MFKSSFAIISLNDRLPVMISIRSFMFKGFMYFKNFYPRGSPGGMHYSSILKPLSDDSDTFSRLYFRNKIFSASEEYYGIILFKGFNFYYS